MSANYNSQNVPRVGIVFNRAKPSVNEPCPARDNIFVETILERNYRPVGTTPFQSNKNLPGEWPVI